MGTTRLADGRERRYTTDCSDIYLPLGRHSYLFLPGSLISTFSTDPYRTATQQIGKDAKQTHISRRSDCRGRVTLPSYVLFHLCVPRDRALLLGRVGGCCFGLEVLAGRFAHFQSHPAEKKTGQLRRWQRASRDTKLGVARLRLHCWWFMCFYVQRHWWSSDFSVAQAPHKTVVLFFLSLVYSYPPSGALFLFSLFCRAPSGAASGVPEVEEHSGGCLISQIAHLMSS